MTGLLEADEPAPVLLRRPDGASPLVLVADHAGNRLPRRLAKLGLDDADLGRHIALDIGILGVAERLSALLDAPLVAQLYSRLVIDCNRRPGVPSSIPEISELTPIPGNRGLTETERTARADAVHRPYHDAIAALLDRRPDAVLIALHSFTPVFKAVSRPWHIGVIWDADDRIARPLLAGLAEEPGLVVGDNQPYAIDLINDYTLPVHGLGRGLAHVEIELRQDLITEEAGQAECAERLARLLPAAAAAVT